MLEFLKEIASRDENFENNSDMWEQIFAKVSDTTDGEQDGENENYKAKYEDLRAKYIARFESPKTEENNATENNATTDTEENENENVSVEDILKEMKE